MDIDNLKCIKEFCKSDTTSSFEHKFIRYNDHKNLG